jgi:prevent-host-death family protein
VAEAAFNVHEAKTHLSRLLRRVVDGDEIVIAKAGKPVARLVPFNATLALDRKLGVLEDARNGDIRRARSRQADLYSRIASVSGNLDAMQDQTESEQTSECFGDG